MASRTRAAYDHRGRMVSKRITENDGNDTLVKSIAYLWGGGTVAPRQGGGMTVTVPAARRNDFFAALRERNVIEEKHAAELPAREVREQERARLDREERARRAAAQGAGQEPANNPPPPAN